MRAMPLLIRVAAVLTLGVMIGLSDAAESPPIKVTITEQPPSSVTSGDHFVLYQFPQDGFEARFPSKPTEYKTDKGVDYGFVNSYQALVASPASQYSVFVNHGKQRVYETEAIDAYLEGMVSGLARAVGAEGRSKTKKIRHLGFPAIEYSFDTVLEGNAVTNRGIVFVVDGDHVRISQIHLRGDGQSEVGFKRFIDSFRLLPIEAPLMADGFADTRRGITFSVPVGWMTSPSSAVPPIVAAFHSLGGHTLTVKDSGVPGYTCAIFRQEVSAKIPLGSVQTKTIRGRRVEVMNLQSVLPQYDVTLLMRLYCWDTSKGAVVLEAGAPQESFFRSQKAFENVAASMMLRQ